MTAAFLTWFGDGCPPRDPLRYDATWALWLEDLWRSAGHGIPSIFV